MDCSPSGSTVHVSMGILQARILEWLAVPSSRGFPDPGIKAVSPVSSAPQVDSLPLEPSRNGESSSVNQKWAKVMITNRLQFISLILSRQIHVHRMNLVLEVRVVVTLGDEVIRY